MSKDNKLYRKENKRALHHRSNDPSGNFRHIRHTKKMQNFAGDKMSMKRTRGGYDYTPLFHFLLTSVGKPWDDVYSEAVSRIDKTDPIFWMVALHEHEKKGMVRIGENSQWSGLFVDVDGILREVDESANANDIWPSCPCCTYSFNGKPVTNKFNPQAWSQKS